jgi:hypothetical protein
MARSRPLGLDGSRGFKVLVLNEVDRWGLLAGRCSAVQSTAASCAAAVVRSCMARLHWCVMRSTGVGALPGSLRPRCWTGTCAAVHLCSSCTAAQLRFAAVSAIHRLLPDTASMLATARRYQGSRLNLHRGAARGNTAHLTLPCCNHLPHCPILQHFTGSGVRSTAA